MPSAKSCDNVTIMRIPALLTIICFALTAGGCGKTNREVIKDNAAAFQGMRDKLAGIAKRLPAPRSVTAMNAQKLDPAPVYQKHGGNMDILMAEQLKDPDAKPEFDLLLSEKLGSALQWTGPQNPMADSALGARGTDLAQELKNALELRYLGVVRIVNFNKPFVLEDRFMGGELTAEVFIIDLSSNNIIPIGPITAKPAENVSFTYKKNESREAAAERFIHSAVYSAARDEVKKLLEQHAGAKVTFD